MKKFLEFLADDELILIIAGVLIIETILITLTIVGFWFHWLLGSFFLIITLLIAIGLFGPMIASYFLERISKNEVQSEI